MRRSTSLLLSFLAGAAAGFVAGLLVAPYSGQETRRRIKTKAKELRDDINEQVDQLSEKISEIAERYTPASKK